MTKNAVSTASLADYAAVINDEHQLAYGCAEEAMDHVRKAGEVLIKAKAAMKHGEWLPWLESNVDASVRTVQSYMRVAQHWSELSALPADTAALTIQGALETLAKPRITKPKPSSRPEPDASADVAKNAEPAYLAAEQEPQPEPQKPAKPVKPAEVEKIQAELEEANSTIKELAAQQQPLQDEVEFLRKIESEGDKLAAACAEVKRLQAVVRGQEERIRGLMNEKNEAVRAAKMWKAKFEKAERAAA